MDIASIFSTLGGPLGFLVVGLLGLRWFANRVVVPLVTSHVELVNTLKHAINEILTEVRKHDRTTVIEPSKRDILVSGINPTTKESSADSRNAAGS